MQKKLMLTLSLDEIGAFSVNEKKLVKLMFQDSYLTERLAFILKKYQDQSNLQIGLMTTTSSVIYLDVSHIKYEVTNKLYKIMLKSRTSNEEEGIARLLKREMRIRNNDPGINEKKGVENEENNETFVCLPSNSFSSQFANY